MGVWLFSRTENWSFGFFFFSLRSFWFIRGVFLFRFRRCWKRCLWNFAALAYQMEPSLLYRATWLGWPGLTSRQLRWGWSWRGPSASVDAAQLWWCAAWLTDTVWGRGLLTLRLRPRESPGGGHVLWITEADFGFNHETVNRHLLIPPKKKTQNKLTLDTHLRYADADHLPFGFFSVLNVGLHKFRLARWDCLHLLHVEIRRTRALLEDIRDEIVNNWASGILTSTWQTSTAAFSLQFQRFKSRIQTGSIFISEKRKCTPIHKSANPTNKDWKLLLYLSLTRRLVFLYIFIYLNVHTFCAEHCCSFFSLSLKLHYLPSFLYKDGFLCFRAPEIGRQNLSGWFLILGESGLFQLQHRVAVVVRRACTRMEMGEINNVGVAVTFYSPGWQH